MISNMINYEDLKIIFGNSIEFEVINMMTSNVEETIDKITSCKFIYSCSLHGLILSHAYGIPCIWFQDRIRSDDYFRFIDHFSAVDIKFYKPLSLQDVKERKRLGDKYEMISKKKLHIIQKELLNRAPFTINNSIILNLIKNDKWENKD